MKINHIITLSVAVALLAACASPFQTGQFGLYPPQDGGLSTTAYETPYQLAPNHWADVAKIRDEAGRLSAQIAEGRITKVQAAQYLNRYRETLVGRNPVDDAMYDVYLRSAVESQSNRISTQQSKQFIQHALQGWQQRWPNMPTESKPINPAFTNFLMEVMGLPPLK